MKHPVAAHSGSIRRVGPRWRSVRCGDHECRCRCRVVVVGWSFGMGCVFFWGGGWMEHKKRTSSRWVVCIFCFGGGGVGGWVQKTWHGAKAFLEQGVFAPALWHHVDSLFSLSWQVMKGDVLDYSALIPVGLTFWDVMKTKCHEAIGDFHGFLCYRNHT